MAKGRDRPRKEPKRKPKQKAPKIPPATAPPPPYESAASVEVIRPKRKEREPDEE